MDDKPNSHALMLYDGLCGFCNGTVRWVLKRDRADRFRFAPQQSPLAEGVMARHRVSREAMLADNSVYLVLGFDEGASSPATDLSSERLLVRSDVTVHVLLLLGGGWRLLGRLLKVVPKSLRDGAYMLVARNRFRFAGRYDACPLPSSAERAKFVG